MVSVKNIRMIFARHKRATLLWIICLTLFGLLLSGHLARIIPFGFAYGKSMWPTFSHLTFVVIDRWFPAYKIQVGDVVMFPKCGNYNASCGSKWLDYHIYFEKCETPDIEECGLTWIDYLTGYEIAHRIIRKNCYALDVNEEVLRYEELEHAEGDIMWWYDNVKECKTTLRTGEQLLGCNDTFEKIDKSKIECVFTAEGDSDKCVPNNFTSKFYLGKLLWYFNFPV